jgi:hypothetical protein
MSKFVNYVYIYLKRPDVKLYIEHINMSYDFAEYTWKGNKRFTVDYSSDGDDDRFEFE